MATCSTPLSSTPLSLSGVGGRGQVMSPMSKSPSAMSVAAKKRRVSGVRAEYRGDSNSNRGGGGGGGGGGDFFAGFVVGGAVFGTLAYIFAPQIRRSLLNEDEYGFRRARKPLYYDEGLERTRQTLNEKISQLNSAIDNVSSRLRGGNTKAVEPADSEVEASI